MIDLNVYLLFVVVVDFVFIEILIEIVAILFCV